MEDPSSSPTAAGPPVSDQENADPAGEGSLRKMFVQGTEQIAKHRTDNLFQSLEQRTLTEEEQKIIEQRVALQRRMFEEYERRERKRKVAELREVCPDVSEEEAEKALDLCDGREDDAAAQLVSDPAFRRRVKAACAAGACVEPAGTAAPVAAPVRREAGGSRSQPSWQAKPGPRPKLIDPASLAGNVFVGAFRGKGFKPPPKGRQAARKAPAAAATAVSSGSGQEEEEGEEEEQEESVQEEELQSAAEGEGQEEEDEDGEQEAQQQGQQKEEREHQQQQAAHEQQQQQGEQQAVAPLASGVLMWPTQAQPQRYVLVQADTLAAPTDSELRAARRDLGEPSVSVRPSATGCGADGHPTPASVARSRPDVAAAAAAAATPAAGEHVQAAAAPPGPMPSSAMLMAMSKQLARVDDAKALALLQKMPSDAVRSAVLEQLGSLDATRAAACWALLAAPAEAAAEGRAEPEAEAAAGLAGSDVLAAAAAGEEQPAAMAGEEEVEEEEEQQPAATWGRGSRQAAAQARQAVKRAASAALSDSDATETEEEPSSSDEEMEQGSSDDDFAAPSAQRNRTARRGMQGAPAPQRRARPSRAAKNAAAATLAAYAVDSEGEDGDEGMAEAAADTSDEEEQPSQRQTRRRGGAGARGGGASRGKRASSPSPAPASTGKKAPARKKQKVGQQAAAAAAAAAGAEEPAAAAGASTAPSSQQEQQQGSGSEAPQQQQTRRGSPGAQEASDGGGGGSSRAPQQPRVRAISSTGHTCRGRVKQKSHKSADLVEAGSLRAEKGWYNAGYIFPEGFQSRTLFRSSVAIDQLCVHECHIMGKGGQYWPQPTFKVVALDRPEEPLIAKSCTGCWTGILRRINAEIEARRKAGEDLPPPPKTAIAGPEYFGLNQPNIQEAVEALDPEELCVEYWAGKRDRLAAAAGLPVASGPPRAQRAPRPPSNSGSRRTGGGGGGGGKGRRRRGGSDTEDEDGAGEGEDDETQFMSSKWSAVSRSDRYRKRLQENGDDTSALDEDNPLPHFIDPITMSAVVRPAISPYGHVAGLATWKVVLAEKHQCPFTNQPLQFEQLKLLSKTNIHLHKHKIVNGQSTATGARE